MATGVLLADGLQCGATAFLSTLLLVLGGCSERQERSERPGAGVSHALARHRAVGIANVRYALDLDVTSLDSATGRVRVTFDLKGSGDVYLDFRGRRLRAASVGSERLPGEAFDGAHVRLPARLLHPGENVAELEFVADIAASGASIIRFHDDADRTDYLYTLLVPSDAQQLFPCFDQPDLKARLTLSLTTPPGWTVVANAPVESVGRSAARHRFAETRPISTYLMAFAAGPWQKASSTRAGRTIHAYVRPSRAHEADLDSLLFTTHRALQWMERYFARAYPFEKFDFVLAPAFPFGGMEHPGAVFFNEDRFIFRERPTLPQRLGRMNTILHEVSHQWFGDLVTMRWFDDLWLKEGFATYMAAKALADLEPRSHAWQNFYLANKPSAYAVDQTLGTTPVWQELANLDQAKSAYGAIVYNKAPSVLKQLEYLVGAGAFQTGVRSFLKAHEWGNATWQDLLQSIGTAAGRSLDDWGRQLILRPGMPIVEQHLSTDNGKIARLALVQRPAQPLSGTGPWPMRIEVLLAYRGRAPVKLAVELAGDTTEVLGARGRPIPAFVFANSQDYGYMLTLLDSASIRALEQGAMGSVEDPLLRAMLWGALWDQVRDARLKPERFAMLALSELPRERDEQILPRLLARLGRTMEAYLDPAARDRLQSRAEEVLWEGINRRSTSYGIRKSYLDAWIDVARTPPGLFRLEGLLSADSAAGEPVRDPVRWSVVNRLLALDAPNAETLLAAQQARDTTPDGRRRAFIAGAARRAAETKREYFARYFADSALNEDWATASLGTFNDVEHESLTITWLTPALDSLRFIQQHRRIFFLGSWLGSFLGGQTSPTALSQLHQFLAREKDLPMDLRQKVLQYGDELERTVRIRRLVQ